MELLPSIGAVGTWSLKDPFKAKYIEGLSYTCKAIRKISEVVGTGFDAYGEHYFSNNIPDSVYREHVSKDVSILTLVSSNGNWLFVPAPYIDAWPSNDAVPYVVMGMLVNLGALPNTVDPSFMDSELRAFIKAKLGSEPDIKYVTLSEVTNKTYDDHLALENARKSSVEDDQSEFVRTKYAEEALQDARGQIEVLQEFIAERGLILTIDQP